MSEPIESARRWSGYVCPDCRFVFRVPQDHDGQGVVCPSCRRMLRIPSGSDVPPPLMTAVRRVEPEKSPEIEGMVKKRRHGRKHPKPEGHSWENEAGRASHDRHEKRRMRWYLTGGVLLLGLIVGGVVVATSRKNQQVVHPPVVVPVKGSAEVSGDPPTTAPERRSDVELLAEIEPLAAKFLQATTVEALLPLVRHPQITGARMKDYYPAGKLTAPGLAKFNAAEGLSRAGDIFSMMVTSGDFQTREMVFEDTAEGLKVDWESWVGWSEMPWEDFRAKRPESALLFRVILSPEAYYNFGFVDEEKWQSYRLISPDGDQAIYGYVAKGTELATQIIPDADEKKTSMTLKLKFPPAATTDNQVEITGFVADGWVEREDAQ